MRIGLIYGSFCLGDEGNAFDLANLWDDPRGLTGSELSYVRMVQELPKLGHDVTAFTLLRPGSPSEWEGASVRSLQALPHAGPGWDAFCSWNEADLLRLVAPDAIRMVNLQINSVGHCLPGFDDAVDVWLSPSEAHRERMLRDEHVYGETLPGPGHRMFRWRDGSKWDVLTNGCDPWRYDVGTDRVSGRVIWASSPDRGLHWLLGCWPRIRREVPDASLRIFYKIKPWLDHMDGMETSPSPSITAQVSRANYIREALRRLEGHGVEVMHSVSRNRMAVEMASAEVLAYPCDTVNWTEGFSVTIMEACAAGAVPVISDVDALGSLYGAHVPTVRSPVGERLDEFSDLVVRALSDPEFRDGVTSRAKELAGRYRWPDIARRLESLIKERRGT